MIPFAAWAFFSGDEREPPNIQGGLIAIGVFAAFAVYGHLVSVRTFVTITESGIEVGELRRVRAARWSDVRYASVVGNEIVLHLSSGKPLKLSSYLEGFHRIASIVDARGLFREE